MVYLLYALFSKKMWDYRLQLTYSEIQQSCFVRNLTKMLFAAFQTITTYKKPKEKTKIKYW